MPTKIEWVQGGDAPGETWNPVTGCVEVSSGCAHCYAKTFAERWRGIPGHPYEQGFDLKLHPGRLEKPLSWKKPRMVFVNSMSDIFHEDIPFDYLKKIFEVMGRAERHTFQCLTKRADYMSRVAPSLEWPPNVWMGVSVENQNYVHRIDELRKVPCAIKFLSCEPLLGPLDLDLDLIDWVIIGGESGPRKRPVDADWMRDIVRQCREQGAAPFVKQMDKVQAIPDDLLIREWPDTDGYQGLESLLRISKDSVQADAQKVASAAS